MAVDLWLDQSAGIDDCSREFVEMSAKWLFSCVTVRRARLLPRRHALLAVLLKVNYIFLTTFKNVPRWSTECEERTVLTLWHLCTVLHCVWAEATSLNMIGPWGRISTTPELWVDFVMLMASTFQLKEDCVIIHISNLTKFCFTRSVLFTLFFNWHVNCSNSLSLKKAEQLVCMLTLTQEETWLLEAYLLGFFMSLVLTLLSVAEWPLGCYQPSTALYGNFAYFDKRKEN